MKKALVVLNPSSGAAGGDKAEEALKGYLDKANLKYEIILTKKDENV